MASLTDSQNEFSGSSTLVVDLSALKSNFHYFKNQLSERTGIMAMVKADAYGCGAVEVSRLLEKEGVEYLGVAYTDEGIHLRNHGLEVPIMVMNPLPQEFAELVRYRLEPELSGATMLHQWLDHVRETDLKDYPVHLEVDTGMRRLGFATTEDAYVAEVLRENPRMRVSTVFSHLASSSRPDHDPFTREQFHRFETWCDSIWTHDMPSPLRHILNSAGICRFPEHQYDMVRLGIGLYGAGMDSLSAGLFLRPVQSMYASVSQVKDIPENETVGYDRMGRLEKPGRIAVLNLGYADGFPRLAGYGRYSVLIEDVLCPTVGTVCMDMVMVDVSHCPEARTGSRVEIYGPGNPVAALAVAAQTIPYEIITANHNRLHRLIRDF